MITAIPAPTYRRLPHVEPQNFAGEQDRERLSPVAIAAFVKIVEVWKLNNSQACALLTVSPSTWDRIKKQEGVHRLNQDQLTRVSALIGILKGLRLLFADDLSSKWPSLPNKGPLFGGLSPIESMLEGGIPRMLEVRRHIDALRGGL